MIVASIWFKSETIDKCYELLNSKMETSDRCYEKTTRFVAFIAIFLLKLLMNIQAKQIIV